MKGGGYCLFRTRGKAQSCQHSTKARDFPGGPVVSSVLPEQGELRAHMPCGMAKKISFKKGQRSDIAIAKGKIQIENRPPVTPA